MSGVHPLHHAFTAAEPKIENLAYEIVPTYTQAQISSLIVSDLIDSCPFSWNEYLLQWNDLNCLSDQRCIDRKYKDYVYGRC